MIYEFEGFVPVVEGGALTFVPGETKIPARMRAAWKLCEPLREVPAERRAQQQTYRAWKESRSDG